MDWGAPITFFWFRTFTIVHASSIVYKKSKTKKQARISLIGDNHARLSLFLALLELKASRGLYLWKVILKTRTKIILAYAPMYITIATVIRSTVTNSSILFRPVVCNI